ncbi:MAG: cobalamin-dependent protein [Thermoleophilia bacterium]|nr:cobalamin-dependent protein [Thermoleophilia bacterium]
MSESKDAVTQERLAAISAAVADLDEKTVISLTKEALHAGDSSVSVVRAVEAGLRTVGERYERQDIYLAGLIMAGEIFRAVMEFAQPGLENELAGNASGLVLLGTVAHDIHDIGKNMAALSFRTFGFTVEDLGEDVPPEAFLEAAITRKPDILGLSGLLSVAFTSMHDTVALIRKHADEFEKMPILVIGGSTIDERVAAYVGADLWTHDAMVGVRLCRQALESRG